jgi:hypothetical protein
MITTPNPSARTGEAQTRPKSTAEGGMSPGLCCIGPCPCPRATVVGCSDLMLVRYTRCRIRRSRASGSLSRSSSSRCVGTCGSGSLTATSRSSWPSVGSRSITSPCTGGCSASHHSWPMLRGRADTRSATAGMWTRPTSRSPAGGATSIGPSTSTARSSTSTSHLGAMPRRRGGSSLPCSVATARRRKS